MADDVADPAVMYAKDGKLYCSVGGIEIPLRHTRESLAASKAQAKKSGDDWDARPKRQSFATRAASATDEAAAAKQSAVLREAHKSLAVCSEARERFAAQAQLREQFDVPAGAKPGDADYEAGEDRFIHQLGRTM